MPRNDKAAYTVWLGPIKRRVSTVRTVIPSNWLVGFHVRFDGSAGKRLWVVVPAHVMRDYENGRL